MKSTEAGTNGQTGILKIVSQLNVRAVCLLLFVLWLALLVRTSFPDPQGTDFFPVYTCTSEVAMLRNPYRAEVSELLKKNWSVASTHSVAPVCAYPLPFYIILTPLVLLPFNVALFLWFSTVLLIPVMLYVWNKKLFLLPFLYYPLFHAASLKTSSVLWLALACLCMLSMKRKWKTVTAFCCTLLPAKPQAGVIISFPLIIDSFKSGYIRPFVLMFSLLWIVPILFIPDWPIDWYSAVVSYSENAINTHLFSSLISFCLVLVALLLIPEISVIGACAIIQLVVFPVNDLYSTISLLLVWANLPWRTSLIGAALSWTIPLLYSYPNSIEPIVPLLLMPPLVVATVLRLRNSGQGTIGVSL